MEVTWSAVSLPEEELLEYRVYYREIVLDQSRERRGYETFPPCMSVCSGTVDGLIPEMRYEFAVTARAVALNEIVLEGEVSWVGNLSTVTVDERGI